MELLETTFRFTFLLYLFKLTELKMFMNFSNSYSEFDQNEVLSVIRYSLGTQDPYKCSFLLILWLIFITINPILDSTSIKSKLL